MIRFRAYPIVERAVDEGVTVGVARAYKHTDSPTREELAESVLREVMSALCEILDFDVGESLSGDG